MSIIPRVETEFRCDLCQRTIQQDKGRVLGDRLNTAAMTLPADWGQGRPPTHMNEPSLQMKDLCPGCMSKILAAWKLPEESKI